MRTGCCPLQFKTINESNVITSGSTFVNSAWSWRFPVRQYNFASTVSVLPWSKLTFKYRALTDHSHLPSYNKQGQQIHQSQFVVIHINQSHVNSSPITQSELIPGLLWGFIRIVPTTARHPSCVYGLLNVREDLCDGDLWAPGVCDLARMVHQIFVEVPVRRGWCLGCTRRGEGNCYTILRPVLTEYRSKIGTKKRLFWFLIPNRVVLNSLAVYSIAWTLLRSVNNE